MVNRCLAPNVAGCRSATTSLSGTHSGRGCQRNQRGGRIGGIQGQVWFDKGEVLSLMLECDGALDAFDQVRFYEAGSAPIVTRAQRRIDDIRIGRGLAQLRGRCG